MASSSARLIQTGFCTKAFKQDYGEYFSKEEFEKKQKQKGYKYAGMDWEEAKNKIIQDIEAGKAKKKIWEYADHDEAEVAEGQMMLLDWPKPAHRYSAILETPHQSIEPIYAWCINTLKDIGSAEVLKITDMFAASEQSSFYGAGMQRLGLAQDRVSQLLATIGQFVRRDLFQLVRDIRWIDERLDYHEKARNWASPKEAEPAELTLKGIWVDLVDGVVQGQRVSANLIQMAQQLQFTSLPDFFFGLHPQKTSEIKPAIDRMQLKNKTLENMLMRKLEQYLNWKEHNYKELKQRKRFELAYLKQHYNIIRMYMQWLTPYLKHIKRLQPNISSLESPELISAFEGSMVEIEVMGKKLSSKGFYNCMMLTLEYRTRPSMSFTQEAGFHRGPIHVGEVKVTWRAYGWTDKDIERYKKFKEMEDIDVLSSIDEAMNSMKEDLKKYLEQADQLQGKEEKKPDKKAPPAPESIWKPFGEVGKGFKELGQIFLPVNWSISPSARKEQKKKAEAKSAEKAAQKGAEKLAKKLLWVHYKLFKKVHGCLAW